MKILQVTVDNEVKTLRWFQIGGVNIDLSRISDIRLIEQKTTEECNCVMSGYAQTTNYCPVHKSTYSVKPINNKIEKLGWGESVYWSADRGTEERVGEIAIKLDEIIDYINSNNK